MGNKKRRPGRERNRIAYTNRCEWCGKAFDCSRPDARSCSNRCKLRFTRWVRKVESINGHRMKWGPRGEWSKCLEALQPDFNGHFHYDRRSGKK